MTHKDQKYFTCDYIVFLYKNDKVMHFTFSKEEFQVRKARGEFDDKDLVACFAKEDIAKTDVKNEVIEKMEKLLKEIKEI